LLAGVYRRHLLETGAIAEAPLHKRDLATASRVWLINSVRGWIDVERVD
jgi:para-aminobenzoate synthetase/4-amino-4-deoxychorismate lyase